MDSIVCNHCPKASNEKLRVSMTPDVDAHNNKINIQIYHFRRMNFSPQNLFIANRRLPSEFPKKEKRIKC